MKGSSLLIILSLCTVICGAKPHLHIKNHKIYDQNGGERIFHGVNLVIKEHPYYDTKFGEPQLQDLKKKGINGIRLGVMWAGVEPKQGIFDEAYIARMVDLVNLAGKYNIYTLVEYHQDLFSQKFCGDGVPIWAVPKEVYQSFPTPVQKHKIPFDEKTGQPTGEACTVKTWSQLYFTRASNRGFGHFWKNKNGLFDKFVNYWKKVALVFNGNPYVIAYELMNEPWPGNFFENPLIMVPGLGQKFHFQSAYDKLSAQIRKVDPDHNICFEPVTWLNDFDSGFTHPPGGKHYQNSSIFCYHYYNPPTLNLNGFMKARLRDVKRLNVGAILSEMFIYGDEGIRNIQMMNKCDEHSHSWFGWLYQHESGSTSMMKQIKRTFSHRVAGSIVYQKFKNDTKEYQLMYHADPEAGETIIYVDLLQDYSGGLNVNIYPSFGKSKYQMLEEYIIIDSKQFENGIPVLIIITP